jgi:diaminopimelate decarboxylase
MRRIEDVDLARVAEDIGTPFYCYSTAALTRAYRAFADAVPAGALIAFSVKANGNLAVLKTLAQLGAGADVVSGGELKKALAAGIPAGRIVFSGVGKTKPELALALEAGIYQFNVESEPELVALNEVAGALNKRAPIALRVNPDVDAKTHAKITTGTSENKFGVPIARAREIYAAAAHMSGIEIVGVDVHIGSQVTELRPFEDAFDRIVELAGQLRADGHAIDRLDLGGGLGVPSDPRAYGAVAARTTQGFGAQLIFEPGRAIVAEAGVLVARVIYVKPGEGRTFLILDAGMNDLIRPALYDAHHDIVSVTGTGEGRAVYDVVGPVCESADVFARDYAMPVMQSGDLVAFRSAGAYGAVMASAYNARPPAAEVLVKGSEWTVVRPRLTDDALIAADRIPHWLGT